MTTLESAPKGGLAPDRLIIVELTVSQFSAKWAESPVRTTRCGHPLLSSLGTLSLMKEVGESRR